MPRPKLLLLSGLLLGACSSEAVRLYELRDADAGTPQRLAYERLEGAVALANEFLHESRYAPIFPAERATFRLDLTDITILYEGEGIDVLRIETSGWGDLRTSMGDKIQTTDTGFMTDRATHPGHATGDGSLDSTFWQLGRDEMASLLLRQAATKREMDARGSTDYWVNYYALGVWPGNGWDDENPVDRRAYAVELAFRTWLDERS